MWYYFPESNSIFQNFRSAYRVPVLDKCCVDVEHPPKMEARREIKKGFEIVYGL
jgi:hypothetical protein